VRNPGLRKSAHHADYALRYDADLKRDKAGVCWRLFAALTRGADAPQSVLDIGCGSGEFLDCAARAGLRAAGIELSPDAARRAADKGHTVFCTSADTSPWPDVGIHDAIVLWDVLEHFERPHQALSAMRRHLAPRGWLIVLSPFIGSVFDRLGLLAHRASGGGIDHLLRMCWSVDHLYRFDPRGFCAALRAIGYHDPWCRCVRVLSLKAESYAGGAVLPNWTPIARINRHISRLGVVFARSLGIKNKMLVLARR
jgi:SAM-dependent methyltransferase